MRAITDEEIFKAMILWGGSFVQGIGRAGLFADEVNIKRLRRAFPDYFLQYTTLAEMAARTNTHQETF
jgi:hypothetical protein